ncbi:MAG: polysaccharide biosynthesis protein [Pseudomonadales bacterium]|nr:polysaccharide biosynthesis protein [Pseudomonadales bacterium]
MRSYLTQLPRNHKKLLSLIFDTLCIWLSLLVTIKIAYFGLNWPQMSYSILFVLAAIAPLITLPMFFTMGLYSVSIRYIHSIAVGTILKAFALSAIAFFVVDNTMLNELNLPLSSPIVFASLMAISLIGGRFMIQRWLLGVSLFGALKEIMHYKIKATDENGTPALIYGRGQDVLEMLKELDGANDYHPVVIIDTENASSGGEVNGRPIYSIDHIDFVMEEFKPKEILLALPSMNREKSRSVLDKFRKFNLPLKISEPGGSAYSHGIQLKDISIDDILGRGEVKPKNELMQKCIKGLTVMVTGAGGSIGSEISRQVIKQGAKRLILVDHSEFNLYKIDQELRGIIGEGTHCELISLLDSVTDQERMYAVMKDYQVNTLYHAAAYKHVPIVEHNMFQGISNNVLGTLSVAQAATAASINNFVLVSTDKAVRPKNVMGASKRFAELILQAISGETEIEAYNSKKHSYSELGKVTNKTCFTIVRFGNVLDSSGSVISLFKEQIKKGGPVTVTHPDINRYFMSIPEAAQLVIQAGSMSDGGEVFLLDMGDPVKITDLAKLMIQLSGNTLKSEDTPQGDIEIVYCGLRPGEKLYEELLIGDNPESTKHQHIFRGNETFMHWKAIKNALLSIENCLSQNDHQALIDKLIEYVDGYDPDSKIVDWMVKENINIS